MTSRLNWRPDGGIVAWVPTETVPRYDLPPSATPIQQDGKPAFHVTLIPKEVMLPHAEALTKLWPGIAEAASDPPAAQLGPQLQMSFNEEKQRTTWFVDVVNAEDYRRFAGELADLIDRTLRSAGYPGFINTETDRYFHVTIANDDSGRQMHRKPSPQDTPGSSN
jgi:hypothetical protein